MHRPGHLRNIAMYLAVSIVICAGGIWRLDLISMEGIIAYGARHMLKSHEWFVPKLYGTIYAFKPAMAYWMAAGGQSLLGSDNALALRLPFVLCAIGLGLVAYMGTARLSNPRAGLYASLATATAAIFIEQARMIGFDMPLALGVSVAIVAALQCLVDRQADWRWWALAYIGLAFGFLAKGLPAAAMYFPGLILAFWMAGQMRQLARWQHLAGLALFAVLAGGYLLLAYREQGWPAFEDQLIEIGYRSARWNAGQILLSLIKPLAILGVTLPWSALVPVLAAKYRELPLEDRTRSLALGAGAFLAAAVIVWMLTPTFNPRYYLPLVVPVAMLAGITAEAIDRAWSQAGGAARPRWARLNVAPVLLAIGLVYWGVFVGVAEPARMRQRSMRQMAATFAPHVPAGASVYIDANDGCSSLFYYLQCDVRRWPVLAAPPAEPIYMVLMNDARKPQEKLVLARDDLQTQILARFSGPEKRSYTLARIGPRPQVAVSGQEPSIAPDIAARRTD